MNSRHRRRRRFAYDGAWSWVCPSRYPGVGFFKKIYSTIPMHGEEQVGLIVLNREKRAPPNSSS